MTVTSITARQRKRKAATGEQEFLMCGCTPEGSAVYPVAIHDAVGPLIIALVCPLCEAEIDVINGRPQE